VSDENIIVMMYDDIATNDENPDQGNVINRPNGPNVYTGVPKDYTGKDVTPTNFLNVLLGQQTNVGSGKTLKTGPNDYIFIYFSDHGAKGLVAFPGNAGFLKATDFMDTLTTMHKEEKYKKMAIYIEACESGSMFKNILPDDINIFATTASNSTTSSYACYWDDKLHTFLGDVYSVKWLEGNEVRSICTAYYKK
jgi:legumain